MDLAKSLMLVFEGDRAVRSGRVDVIGVSSLVGTAGVRDVGELPEAVVANCAHIGGRDSISAVVGGVVFSFSFGIASCCLFLDGLLLKPL